MRFPILLLVLAACGGTEPEAAPDEQPTSTGGEESGSLSQRIAFHDMTMEQRGQFMAETVMPEMQTLFSGFDSQRFASISCATCHGENARDVGFHMPNGLAPLDPTTIPAMFEHQEPMALFMGQQVMPKMAELLGEEVASETNHDGFGCFGCHADATAAQ